MAPSRPVIREVHFKSFILIPQTPSGKNMVETFRRVIIALSATPHVLQVHKASMEFCFKAKHIQSVSTAGDAKLKTGVTGLEKQKNFIFRLACSKKDNLERQVIR
jgi:hypothetical protein